MAEFPVDPMLAKMIIQSEKYGVSGGPAGWVCLALVMQARNLAPRAAMTKRTRAVMRTAQIGCLSTLD